MTAFRLAPQHSQIDGTGLAMSSGEFPVPNTDVTSFVINDLPLQVMYENEAEKIRLRYQGSQNGQAVVCERSDLLDLIVTRLWSSEILPLAEQGKICAVGLGGYGRRALFPFSDIDLLFLSEESLGEAVQKQALPKICRALWDLRLRVSPTIRSLAECGKLYRDNFEFNVALLDCRYVCGNRELFEALRGRVLPKMVAAEAGELRQRLIDLSTARHQKYGKTVYQLEPDVKECPGGLRDYQVAVWLGLISELARTGSWPEADSLLPEGRRSECAVAVDFLTAVRCFLHYRQGRDLNILSYELQAEAALGRIGVSGQTVSDPAEWMRAYFRKARAIYRLEILAEEARPPRSGFYRLFESQSSRLSNADFSVVEGRVFLRQLSSAQDPSTLLGLFEFVARHGLKLSGETERCVEAALPALAQGAGNFWPQFQRLLISPYAATALRAMHSLGALTALFPQFRAIDALVVRDYYHRYTVDEHSLVAIENLHALRSPQTDLERRFTEIYAGLEHPELLFLAMLFHDLGKGGPGDHVEGSVAAVREIVQRLRLDPGDAGTVIFLVANHLRMSATVMRRDIFDPAVVCEFSELVKAAEPLKMLALLTYADVKSVNPEALTPWKAEMLWQLYAAAFNHLSREIDDQRVHVMPNNDREIAELISAAGGDVDSKRITKFLEGFPKRYLLTHSAEQVISHYHMYEKLQNQDPQISIIQRNGYFEVVLLTLDCPFLFAGIAGTLSSWGMNILKADAYSNKAGVVLDSFRIADRFHTLEMNPAEVERLKSDLADAVAGEVDVAEWMRAKFKPAEKTPKVKVEPRLHLDNNSSHHSTLIEVTAQDRPGLLYEISVTLSELGCNIEAGIIDTQGQTAIDVFYVTCAGAKLDRVHQQKLRADLLSLL